MESILQEAKDSVEAFTKSVVKLRARVDQAERVLAVKLARVSAKMFKLEAEEVAKVPHDNKPSAPPATKYGSHKPSLTNAILANVTTDKLPAERELVQGSLGLEASTPVKPAKAPRKPSATTIANRMTRAARPRLTGGVGHRAGLTQLPQSVANRLRAKMSKKGWNYEKVGTITGTDSKFVWRFLSTAKSRKPQTSCSYGELLRFEAAADIVERFDPPTKALDEGTRLRSQPLIDALKELVNDVKADARISYMARQSGRDRSGLQHVIKSTITNAETEGIGRSKLWQFQYDRKLRKVILADETATRMLIVPKWTLGTRKK